MPPNPSVERIWQWYRRRKLDRGWSRERFNRLCQMLRCTRVELTAFMAVPTGTMNKWLSRNRIPPYLALHLEALEAWHLQRTSGFVKMPVQPVHFLLNSGSHESRHG